ncbi:MAG: cupin domain-containing protein [Nitrospinaceae bacterium]|jgi:quercetin dioxygenase-like cupin family protein|nr:cupin domain-containing protein [Nitrospinaceae bacterium]MBT3433374.1 cupin domain-containing protein [Nitrospinaceae bacterium]MBT3820485.1 cupin domain-containing protein [Nitrospinaceae bacterium]MBT4095344.1 cupin domain-containing protein [Nitrospinaceae bacterium]MBT4431374.1 cupin domain-containing protein [Nitrospinaceae bacterium]
MKVKNYKDVELKTEEAAKGAGIRWLLSDRDGMTDMAMRVIEIESGGQTPHHSHPWEHQVFVLKGSGRVVTEEDGTREFSPGAAIFIGPNEEHTFHNDSDETMEFVCMIPVRATLVLDR